MTARAASGGVTGSLLRMKDLVRLTGLARQVIHFYIQQGLLPPGRKTGRNMAFYGKEHVARLELIRELQHERFMPLKAIKALIEGTDDEAFSAPQRRLLSEVKDRLGEKLGRTPIARDMEPAEQVAARAGVDVSDIERAVELGLLGGRRNAAGALLVGKQDAWLAELWGEMQQIGFTKERGFRVDDLTIYEEAIGTLFRREARMLTTRLATVAPDEVARMIEQSLPLVHGLLTRYHAMLVRDLLAAVAPAKEGA